MHAAAVTARRQLSDPDRFATAARRPRAPPAFGTWPRPSTSCMSDLGTSAVPDPTRGFVPAGKGEKVCGQGGSSPRARVKRRAEVGRRPTALRSGWTAASGAHDAREPTHRPAGRSGCSVTGTSRRPTRTCGTGGGNGGTHVSVAERTALDQLRTGVGRDGVGCRPAAPGLASAGWPPPSVHVLEIWMLGFHKGREMSLDLTLVNCVLVARAADVWVGRDARRGKRRPSTHRSSSTSPLAEASLRHRGRPFLGTAG